MRVVGGAWKGRRLLAPAGRATRPTSDKVREAVFDVLVSLLARRGPAHGGEGGVAGPLAGHAALDLFAGSGALGIEALSRGAASCAFIEHDRSAVRALRENLVRLEVGEGGRGTRSLDRTGARPAGAEPRVRVLGTGFERALQADARAGARYTLVFVDPPYERYAGIEPALARLVAPLLAPLAVVVVETAASARITLPWAVVREKRYGDTKVTFLVAEPADEQKEPATTMDAATHDGGAAR